MQSKCAAFIGSPANTKMSMKCFGIFVWLLLIAVTNAAFFLYLWYRFSHYGGQASADGGDIAQGLPSNLSITDKEEVGREVNSLARLIEMDATIGTISGE